MGSSRREEALKKPSAFGSASGNLPSPPREHEESPGKRPPRSANACLQANAAAAAGATLTHLQQHHQFIISGDLAASLGRRSGMLAGMVATLSSSPQALHRSHHASSSPANAISRRQWHKLVFSAGLRLAPSSRDAGEYLHAANCRVSVAWVCACVSQRSQILSHRSTSPLHRHHHKRGEHQVSSSIIARIIHHHHRYLKLAQGRRRCSVPVAGKLVRAALAPQESKVVLRSPHRSS